MGRVLRVPGGVGPKLDSEEGADRGPRGPILPGLVLGARAELGAKQELPEAGLSVARGPCWGLGCPLQQEASITANPCQCGGSCQCGPGAGPETSQGPFSSGSQSFQKTEDSGGMLKTGDSVKRTVTPAFRVFSKSNLRVAPLVRAAAASCLDAAVAPGGPQGPSPSTLQGLPHGACGSITGPSSRSVSPRCVRRLPPLPISWRCRVRWPRILALAVVSAGSLSPVCEARLFSSLEPPRDVIPSERCSSHTSALIFSLTLSF